MAGATQQSVRIAEGKPRARRPDSRRSGGPRTAAGKARSARNAWKHGLRARKVLVCQEDAGQYAAFRARMFQKWAPRDDDEAFLVHRMTGVMWRLLRCPETEAELLDTLRDPDAPGGGMARAFLPDGTADGASIVRFARYETALERSYFRCLKMLRLLHMVGGAGPSHAGPDEGTGRAGNGASPVADDWAETAEAAQGIEIIREEDWDDMPVEVEEVILDADEPDDPLDGREGETECPPMRPKAVKFPNELDAAMSDQEDISEEAAMHRRLARGRAGDRPAQHAEGEAESGATPVRDWPGEPDYQPRKEEPIRYSEFATPSVFGDQFKR